MDDRDRNAAHELSIDNFFLAKGRYVSANKKARDRCHGFLALGDNFVPRHFCYGNIPCYDCLSPGAKQIKSSHTTKPESR